MKKVFFLCALIFPNLLMAQVGVNSDNSVPHPSAQLDVKSTNKGLLLPRITSPTSAISSPTAGLMVYDQANANLAFYNGSNWNNISGTAGSSNLYARFPNSFGYYSTLFTAAPSYSEFVQAIPAGITKIWIEAWAAGNAGGLVGLDSSPSSSMDNYTGGTSGDFASFLIALPPGTTSIVIRVGKGGYGNSNGTGGSTDIIVGPNTYRVTRGGNGILLNGNYNVVELIQFIGGQIGNGVDIDFLETSAGVFKKKISGGNGGDAYPRQKGGRGLMVLYSTTAPYSYDAYGSYSGGNGAIPGGGGGVGFGTAESYRGYGGAGMVILHY